MSKETRITADGATVKTKGQDIIVTPKRLSMYLTAIIIGLFGLMALPLGLISAAGALTEGELDRIFPSLAMAAIGGGLLSIAYFAFNKGRSQKAIHFDATNHQIKVGDEIIPFDNVTGVYLRRAGNTQLGDISSMVIQTGIVADNKSIPIVSVSKAKREDNMSDAASLIRLYAEHLGYDPKTIGRYEDILKINLSTSIPVVLPFKSSE